MTYVCSDYYGNELTVEESGIGGQPDRFVRVYSRGGSYIRDDAAVNLARALCRAAGRDVIILDRPDGAARMDGCQPGDVMFRLGDQGEIAIVCGDCGTRESHPPERARELAGWIAALADRAESEPDPDEVDALEVMFADMVERTSCRDMARAVLRAGYKREVAT